MNAVLAATMIPKKVYDLCQGGQSISSELAKNPTLSPQEAAKKLFGIGAADEIVNKTLDLGDEKPSDLEEARNCGNWGISTPSDLFLRVGICDLYSWEMCETDGTPRSITMYCARWRRIPWWACARPRSWEVTESAR